MFGFGRGELISYCEIFGGGFLNLAVVDKTHGAEV